MDKEEVKRFGAGAPLGNKNASKAHLIRNQIKAALDRRDAKLGLEEDATIRYIFDAYVEEVVNGVTDTRKDFMDRLYGKPKQQMELSGDAESPVAIVWPLPKSPLDR